LKELSLKENQLKNSPFSLDGLLFFSFDDSNNNINNNDNINGSSSSSKLMILSMEDNPLCESSKLMRVVTETLITKIPSLVSINSKQYRSTRDANKMNVVSILQKGQSSSSSSNAMSLSEKGFENMEKEYLSALRGERETTVIS